MGVRKLNIRRHGRARRGASGRLLLSAANPARGTGTKAKIVKVRIGAGRQGQIDWRQRHAVFPTNAWDHLIHGNHAQAHIELFEGKRLSEVLRGTLIADAEVVASGTRLAGGGGVPGNNP